MKRRNWKRAFLSGDDSVDWLAVLSRFTKYCPSSGGRVFAAHLTAMASRPLNSVSFLRWFLLLALLSSLSPARSSSRVLSSVSDDNKVSLALYYEALCPYSANFIINYLVDIFQDGLISIIDLNLVPFGNARIGYNNTIDCQHGPLECLLNTVEACAINVWPDLNEHFPVIDCIETLVYQHNYSQWYTCFETLGLDPKPVIDCYNSGYGKELELQYAAETNALQPPHQYVPWVVVDGQPLYEDYENFISYVCKGYTGTEMPKACIDISLDIIPRESSNDIHPVCYADETTNLALLLARIRSAITLWMHRLYNAASL